jgi:general secretion pathway protein H
LRNSPQIDAGFTLLEMMVVIAIMGLTLLLISSYLQPHSRWLETQAAGRQVAEAMRDARGSAIVHGQPVALVLPHLPAWLPVAVQAPAGAIVFEPDGSASGGRVVLGDASQTGSHQDVVVSVDWLTGRVQTDAH